MRFRAQLVIGHTALLFTTILTGSVAVVALHVVTARLDSVTRDLAADMIVVERLRFESEQLVATSRGFLLTGEPATWSRFGDAARRLDASLAQLRRRPGMESDVSRIERASRAYVRRSRQAAEQRTNVGDPTGILPFFEQTLTPARERFEGAIADFVHREQEAFEDESLAARELARDIAGVVIVTTACGVLLGIVLAWISMRKLNAHYAREREATAIARHATAARDELLAVVSHDLRTPLGSIMLGMSILRDSFDTPFLRKHIVALSDAAVRMQHMLDELLDVAKLESGTFELDPQPCDPRMLLESTVSLFQARALDSQIALVVEADDASAVFADRERVLQVLSNLVANALKVTPSHGRITIATRTDVGHVRFEVRDTGPGVPAGQQPKLFERYWQGPRRERGSIGLGLYICKRLVTAHRGEIGLDSRPGEGATFWFTLPRPSMASPQ